MSRSFLPRTIREGLNKALGYLQSEQLDKALDCMIMALKELAKQSMSALKEAQPTIQRFLHAFEKHPRVRILLEQKEDVFASIPYRLGIEARLAVVLEGMAKILQEQAELSAKEDILAEDRQRQHYLMQTGLQHLEEGQIVLAEAFFQRLLTEFPQEKELLLACARHLEAAGYLEAACRFYEKILEIHPMLAEASSAAIDCCLRCKDYAMADEFFKHVLRVFGAHPKTLLRRAHLYVLMNRSEEASAMLEEALAKDPTLVEARALWDELHKPC
ncbi:MAG: hypothetical protein J5846_11160 [Desulfovibrio sp.]|nr:hypothetical protein [Desulfovibrio sp.]